MRRSEYFKQLDIDLQRWASLGLIERDRIDALRKDAGPAERHYSLSGILSMLGAILLACAIVAFIGANWQALPRLVKLGAIVALMAGAYAAAVALTARNRAAFAEGALLLGSVLFGANIMLIGQIYHINAGWPEGVLLWAGGAFGAAFLVSSHANAILALLLFCIWSGGITLQHDGLVHWPFLLALVAMTVLARTMNFRALVHLIVLAFLFWSIANGAAYADHLGDGAFSFFIALMTTLGLAIWLGGGIASALGARYGGLIGGYGLFFLSIVVFFIQLTEGSAIDPEVLAILIYILGGLVCALLVASLALRSIAIWDALIATALTCAVLANGNIGEPWPKSLPFLYAGLDLLYIAWLLVYGLRTKHAFAVNLAFVAFGAQVLYLYFEVFGTMLQQSAFFAIGGVLFLSAAYVLERVRRQVIAPKREGAR